MGSSTSRLYIRHPRLSVLASLLLASILLLSIFHYPDPTSPSFQFPGFLPSRYPPSRHPSNALLDSRLLSAANRLAESCSGPLEPIYVDPGLTIAQERRYAHLRKGQNKNGRYMIVTTIREIKGQLPDLLNALVVLITFLGPKRLSFSILEGPSGDCTPEALENGLGPTLLNLGIPQHHLHLVTRESKIDFGQHNRIEVLAGLRNRALAPLWDPPKPAKGREIDEILAVVMLNDVFLKASDILELLHQHVKAGAGITTAWDWLERDPRYYYDIWVGRTIDTGDLFYPIQWPWWSPSEDLFSTSAASRHKFDTLQPFQVYSSWNGIAVLDPAPFLPPHNVRFRRGDQERGECAASECSLIAQDFWKAGYGRVQVVPSVQLGYQSRVAKLTRDELLSQKRDLSWRDEVPPSSRDSTVQFTNNPPDKVRCHAWPEKNGLDANVWEETLWVDPLTGVA